MFVYLFWGEHWIIRNVEKKIRLNRKIALAKAKILNAIANGQQKSDG